MSNLALVSLAGAQLQTPVLSPRSTLTQVVGIADVTIDYSRPSKRGREIIGELVPYNEVWRTGANAATTISFSDDAIIEGNPIKAGKYAIYTIPGESNWTIILSNNTASGANYPEGDDALRFNVKPARTPETVETLAIDIIDLKQTSARVQLWWENTRVRFELAFDVDAKIMSAINAAMSDMVSDNAQLYFQSAEYYFNNNKDLRQALEWVSKSVEMNENAYWAWRLKSRVMASLKDYKGAIEAAEMSKSKARAAGNTQFVQYNEEAIAEWRKKR